MPDIRAFRYDLGRVGALSDVVAPPYDVIDPALQDALYRRSPYPAALRVLLRRRRRHQPRHPHAPQPAQ
jgi:hypothetical protein